MKPFFFRRNKSSWQFHCQGEKQSSFPSAKRTFFHVKTCRETLSSTIEPTIKTIFPKVRNIAAVQESNLKNADFQMSLFPVAKQSNKEPKVVFNELQPSLEQSSLIDRVFFTEPAFLNIKVRDSFLSEYLNQFLNEKDPREFYPFRLQTKQKKKILVDFSSPNLCKELHVGHLRSTILGDSISRLLEYLGHEVERISHLGDFGTPIGLVIAEVIHTNRTWPSMPTPPELSEIYINAKKRASEDQKFFVFAQKVTTTFQSFLSGTLKTEKANEEEKKIFELYQIMIEASKIGASHLYEKLDVKIRDRGESFYAPLLEGIVKELEEKQLVTENEGAKVILLPSYAMMIQKSDHSFLYATTDLAAMKFRLEEQLLDWVVYVTDDSQKQHFKHLQTIAKKAGWLDSSKHRIDHVSFGVIRNPDTNEKFSSRSGQSFPLDELITEVQDRYRQIQENLNPELSKDAQHITNVALSSIKYFDLCHQQSYSFSMENMLATKGKSAVYINYAFTRIHSIKAKLNNEFPTVFEPVLKLETEEERHLALQLGKFPDALYYYESNLQASGLCEYLYELAHRFHHFYDHCKVIGSDTQTSRLQLCFATEKVIHVAMELLGLKPTKRL